MLSIVDRLTGFVRAIPLSDKSSPTIQNALIREWFTVFGLPKLIHCDNGIFSKETKEWLLSLDITVTHSANYAHHQNGVVERFNQELLKGLKVNMTNKPQNKWTQEVFIICWRHNLGIKENGHSPYELMFGRDGRTVFYEDWEHLRQNLTKEELQDKEKNIIKKSRSLQHIFIDTSVRVGDIVFWKPDKSTGKFSLPYGPFVIVEQVSNNVLLLQDLQTKRSFTAERNRVKVVSGLSEAELGEGDVVNDQANSSDQDDSNVQSEDAGLRNTQSNKEFLSSSED